MAIEREVELRRKRQMTWPEELATAMQVSEGSYLIVEYDPERDVAMVRRRPDSYAGILRGVFGAPDEAERYLKRERLSWSEEA